MTDPARGEQDPYDLVPYGSHSWQDTHPDHLAAVAWIRGLVPPRPETARVLELGCASGGNLLPMAASLPDARFLGIDRAPGQVAEGKALQAEAGLQNIELRAADLREPGDLGEGFDYILAHGLWSWLPPDVRGEMLALVGRVLRPNGVAFISTNMLPGWHFRQIARDLMRMHTRDQQNPRQQVQEARAVLKAVAEAAPADALHGACLCFEALDAERRDDQFLFHDQLAEHNHPVLLETFVEEAARFGLRYLGDARPPDMVPESIPEEIDRALLAAGAPLWRRLQYGDFVMARSFRRHLLTPPGPELPWPPDPDRLQGMHVVGRLSVTEVTGDEAAGLEKATLDAVGAAWPASIPVDALATNPTEARRVRVLLLQAFLAGALRLRLRPSPATREPGIHPRVPIVARLQAARGELRVTSALHADVVLDPLQRQLLPLLDGRHDREELARILTRRLLAGELPVKWEGAPLTDPAVIEGRLGELVDGALASLGEQGMLLAPPGC